MDNANQKLGQSSRRTFNHVFWQTFRLINKTTISLWDSGYLCKLEFSYRLICFIKRFCVLSQVYSM